MGRFGLVAAMILVIVAGAYGALLAYDNGYRLPFTGEAPPAACTVEDPCEIRILFAYTEAGSRSLGPDVDLERLADEDVEALRRAFRISGVTNIDGGRESIVFAAAEVLDRPVDGGSQMRLDRLGAHGDPASFNRTLLGWLPDSRALKGPARRANITVVFTGLAGPQGECYANALASRGYVLIPGCLLGGAEPGSDRTWAHQIMFLHEVGHLFGAYHNDNGAPQPCSSARESGHDPKACAWEQCLDRSCSAEELRFARDAFCTLVGQYNFNAGPTGETFCRAHRGGERGSGWIREYSHPGKCRTPGFERYDCGDEQHDAVSVMRARAPVIAARRTGWR